MPSKKTVVTGQMPNLLGAQEMYNANRPITASNVQANVNRGGSLNANANVGWSTTHQSFNPDGGKNGNGNLVGLKSKNKNYMSHYIDVKKDKQNTQQSINNSKEPQYIEQQQQRYRIKTSYGPRHSNLRRIRRQINRD